MRNTAENMFIYYNALPTPMPRDNGRGDYIFTDYGIFASFPLRGRDAEEFHRNLIIMLRGLNLDEDTSPAHMVWYYPEQDALEMI